MAGRIKDREDREVYSAPWIGGGERSEPITRMPIRPCDTESQSRNADFLWTSPFGLEGSGACGARGLSFVCCALNDGFGPQSGLVQRVVLYAVAWGSENRPTGLRSGGRRLAVRTAMEHPIGALPRTPFPASRDFPSRGNERYEGKNSESYTSRTISAFSPFGGCRHHLARWEACHMI